MKSCETMVEHTYKWFEGKKKKIGGDDTSVHEPQHCSSVSSIALHDVRLVSKSSDCLFLVWHLMLESQNQTLLKQKYPAFLFP